MNAVVACDDIEFYGRFLKLLGMSALDTGHMFIYGGADYGRFGDGITHGPEMTGTVSFGTADRAVFADITGSTLKKSEHVHSLLLVSGETGCPVPAKYIEDTRVEADKNGIVTRITLSLPENDLKGKARIYYMVDTYPAAKGSIIALGNTYSHSH